MTDDAAQEVRLGAVAAWVGHAVRNAPGLFAAACIARFAIEAVPAVWTARAGIGVLGSPSFWALTSISALATALVTGLVIRWLLEPKRRSLAFDRGLAAYVVLILLFRLPPVLGAMLLRPAAGPGPLPERLAASFAVTGMTLGWSLALATLALWPIGFLMADRLTAREAFRRMGPAYGVWLLTYVILLLPGLALTQIQFLVHHLHRALGDRLADLAIGSLTTTLATFALAYIYARRVKGRAPAVDGRDDGAPKDIGASRSGKQPA